jgi:succinate dehydrogenase/fumarate reductase-like Fe-S protein
MSSTATLKVWRGLDAKAGHVESYEVPFEPGQSVLDGLRWIRANRDRRSRSGSPASTPMPARNA